jgi:hypothetical protein
VQPSESTSSREARAVDPQAHPAPGPIASLDLGGRHRATLRRGGRPPACNAACAPSDTSQERQRSCRWAPSRLTHRASPLPPPEGCVPSLAGPTPGYDSYTELQLHQQGQPHAQRVAADSGGQRQRPHRAQPHMGPLSRRGRASRRHSPRPTCTRSSASSPRAWSRAVVALRERYSNHHDVWRSDCARRRLLSVGGREGDRVSCV